MATIRSLESLSLNAWPGVQTYHLDGWVLGYADGFTKRANSVHPLWAPADETERLVDRCESFYEDRGHPTVFKLTEGSQPTTLDTVLDARGYRLTGRTSVRLKSLDGGRGNVDERVSLTTGLSPSFIETYARLWGLTDGQRRTFREMMRVSPCETVCATLELEGQAVACGLAVLDRGYIGLLGIRVDESVRRQGHGRRLTTAVLADGRCRGAETAWLQVETENTGASTLYESLGFTEAYCYWYRTSR